MKIDKCPVCQSTEANVETDAQMVCRCPECFHLFYVPSEQEPNASSFLHFDLLEEIGQGSNAIVYKAWNKLDERFCALKLFLCPDFADGESDFTKEFEFAASLIHPNIIRVFSGGSGGRAEYLESELFESMDLNDYIEEYKKMPIDDAIAVGCEVCKALDYVWSNHLAIHRDIKPHNILLNNEGEIKICDFGMVNEHGEWFDELKIEGTPFYLSPESISGDYQDNRSDIYALGVTLFHLIAGEPPFDDPSLKKTIYARLESSVPDIRMFDISVSQSAALVLQTMMSVDPDDRYVTANECLDDLIRLLNEEPPELVDATRPKINH
ncbi:MAG: serine/threonine protein kinase [Lentisphaeraceae bacterium]|nr:serine/threonine protein kinase [Lentisphaeraceae bacterium]